MSAQACNQPLKSGARCRNPVGPATTRCAAGHPVDNGMPGKGVHPGGACQMLETEDGWMCEVHDLESEEWQVLLALGARPPCRVPGDAGQQKQMARNPSTPIGTLFLLSWDESGTVRRGVVDNPRTPVSILERLAKDEDKTVREAVAWNPSTPVSILERLAKEENWAVRQGVAENPSTPATTLGRLAGDDDETVRWRVARNPSTPANTLERLARDMGGIVRAAAQQRVEQSRM